MRFGEFWPTYLIAHRKPGTRSAHYLATALGAGGGLAAAFGLGNGWVFPLCLLGAYLIAFSSHWIIERNQPVVVNSPRSMLFGAWADLRMCGLALRGRVDAEYERLGLKEPTPERVEPRLVIAAE